MTQCPQCGRVVDAGSDFCPSCGHYVGWDKTMAGANPMQPPPPAPPKEPVVQSLPPQEPRQQRPQLQEVEAPPPPVIGPSYVCRVCGDVNSASRTYCQRCGERLPTEPPTASQPAVVMPPEPYQQPPFPPYQQPRQVNGKLILGVLLAAALILIGVIFAVSRGGDKGTPPVSGRTSSGGTVTTQPPTSGGSTTASSQPPAEPTEVDPGTIDSQASSELAPEDGFTYGVANTLDGDPKTAWNSDGDKVGTGVGQVLTYRFADKVHLRRIELVDGYAKNDTLFHQNGRIKSVAITTDAGTAEVTLTDTMQAQNIDQDFGVTNSVTLRVLSVYKGSKYLDLGLSEIAFWATPAA